MFQLTSLCSPGPGHPPRPLSTLKRLRSLAGVGCRLLPPCLGTRFSSLQSPLLFSLSFRSRCPCHSLTFIHYKLNLLSIREKPNQEVKSVSAKENSVMYLTVPDEAIWGSRVSPRCSVDRLRCRPCPLTEGTRTPGTHSRWLRLPVYTAATLMSSESSTRGTQLVFHSRHSAGSWPPASLPRRCN